METKKFRLIKRYFGVLCDKEQKEDEEVFDEDVVIVTEDLKTINDKIFKIINQATVDGFVIDEDEGRKDIIRLFFSYQENWNEYFEIIIEEVNTSNVMTIDIYKNELISNIIQEIKKYYNKVKNLFLEEKRDNLVSEMSLILELSRYLENQKTNCKYSLSELELIFKNGRGFIDEFTSIYYNSDLGNSYEDIQKIIEEYIREYEEVEE